MKKVFYFMALVAMATLTFSCDKDPEVKPDEGGETNDTIIPEDNGIEFVEGYVDYYGTLYSETYNFNVVLYTEMTTDEEGYFNSKGNAVQLDLYTTDSTSFAGTYTIANNYNAGSCEPEYSAWYEIDDAGEQTWYGLKEGTITVTKDGDVYSITMDLIDSLDVTHKGYFTGVLEFYDNTSGGEGEYEDDPYAYEPTEPLALNHTAESASATNYGDYYGTGANNYTLELYADTLSIGVELFTAANSEGLEAGTYQFAETYEAGTMLPGSLFWGMFPSGTYAMSNNIALWFVDGSLTIAKDGENYDISANLTSAYGSTLELSYHGEIPVEVYEEESYEAPARKATKKVAFSSKKQNKRIAVRK